MNYYKLTKDNDTKFIGSENECYYKLQQSQSQSAEWAIKYEGWNVSECTKLQGSKLDLFYKKLIVSWIDLAVYEIEEPETLKEKLDILKNIFINETGKKELYQRDIKEHLMGLPSILSLVCGTYDIINLLKETGVINQNTTEGNKDKLIKNYFNFISAKLLQLFNAPKNSTIFKKLEA